MHRWNATARPWPSAPSWPGRRCRTAAIHGYKDLAVRFRRPEQRAAAEAELAAAGVMTKRYFFPVHRMEAYREYAVRPLPVTDSLYERLLCIPVYHDLRDEQIDDIAGRIGDGLRRARRPEYHFHPGVGNRVA